MDLQMKWSRSLLILTLFFRSSCRRTSLLQVSKRLFTTLATFFPAKKDKRRQKSFGCTGETDCMRSYSSSSSSSDSSGSAEVLLHPQWGFGLLDSSCSVLHCMHCSSLFFSLVSIFFYDICHLLWFQSPRTEGVTPVDNGFGNLGGTNISIREFGDGQSLNSPTTVTHSVTPMLWTPLHKRPFSSCMIRMNINFHPSHRWACWRTCTNKSRALQTRWNRLTVNVLQLDDSSWKAVLESFRLLSFHRLQQGDLGEESVAGCGHRGELGVILAWTRNTFHSWRTDGRQHEEYVVDVKRQARVCLSVCVSYISI